MLAKVIAGGGIGILSGLGMGFGYGYGVRAGYNAYKPNKSSKINSMVHSLNPVQAGAGMGLDVASRRTPPASSVLSPTEPTFMPEKRKLDSLSSEYFKKEYTNPKTGMTQSRDDIVRKGMHHGLSPKVSVHRFMHGIPPFGYHRTQKYQSRRT